MAQYYSKNKDLDLYLVCLEKTGLYFVDGAPFQYEGGPFSCKNPHSIRSVTEKEVTKYYEDPNGEILLPYEYEEKLQNLDALQKADKDYEEDYRKFKIDFRAVKAVVYEQSDPIPIPEKESYTLNTGSPYIRPIPHQKDAVIYAYNQNLHKVTVIQNTLKRLGFQEIMKQNGKYYYLSSLKKDEYYFSDDLHDIDAFGKSEYFKTEKKETVHGSLETLLALEKETEQTLKEKIIKKYIEQQQKTIPEKIYLQDIISKLERLRTKIAALPVKVSGNQDHRSVLQDCIDLKETYEKIIAQEGLDLYQHTIETLFPELKDPKENDDSENTDSEKDTPRENQNETLFCENSQNIERQNTSEA